MIDMADMQLTVRSGLPVKIIKFRSMAFTREVIPEKGYNKDLSHLYKPDAGEFLNFVLQS